RGQTAGGCAAVDDEQIFVCIEDKRAGGDNRQRPTAIRSRSGQWSSEGGAQRSREPMRRHSYRDRLPATVHFGNDRGWRIDREREWSRPEQRGEPVGERIQGAAKALDLPR